MDRELCGRRQGSGYVRDKWVNKAESTGRVEMGNMKLDNRGAKLCRDLNEVTRSLNLI